MATAAVAAFGATIEISTDGGSNYNTLGEMKNVTLTVEGTDIDATSLDSSGWEESILGLKRWTWRADGFYLEGNTGQDATWTAITGGTTVRMRFRPKGAGSSQYQFVGDARITSYELPMQSSDALAINLAGKGTAALTRSAQ